MADLQRLVEDLNSVDFRRRQHAVEAITALGAEAVPRLRVELADGDPARRRRATWALGKVGGAAEAAVPDLCKLLWDPDASLRAAAAEALGGIGSAAAVIPLC